MTTFKPVVIMGDPHDPGAPRAIARQVIASGLAPENDAGMIAGTIVKLVIANGFEGMGTPLEVLTFYMRVAAALALERALGSPDRRS